VLKLWQSYKAGEIDWVPVAMATNAAIAFADQMEKEFLEDLYPEDKPKRHVYQHAGVASSYGAITSLLLGAIIGRDSDTELDLANTVIH
jgi:hypothetical protein